MLFFIQFFAIEFYHSTVFFQLIAIIFVELAIYIIENFFYAQYSKLSSETTDYGMELV